MKTNFTIFPLVVLLLLSHVIQAQTPGIESSVKIAAQVDASVNFIDVQWDPVPDADTYAVYKKIKGGNSWTTVASYLPPSTLNYFDNNVLPGVSYEYKVKCDRLSNTKEAFGYINAGGYLPFDESRGRILLLIDDHFQSSLSFEIDRLENDLIGDGWKVTIEYVNRSESPQNVKSRIITVYGNHPDLEALYLLGQIPVPYSGAIAPDGHFDHLGAWPTDGYYGDLDYVWTDNSTNSTQANHPRNHNVPNDGKFDHSYFPSNVELQVGRVDFRDLPAFAESEEDLLRYYLDKSHLFKTGQITADHKAVIDDNFTAYDFSNSAWKGYSALVGKENVEAQDYLTCLQNKSHLFSYGSGGGTYSSASGVITTQDYANESPKGIFTMLLGSYFGEWNTTDNLMRAAIASGDILTSTWVGLPNYYFHHMAMGESIGYGLRLSQNNSNTKYEPAGFYARMIHMNLMGDPTLRMHYFDTPKNAGVQMQSGDAVLTWQPSTDSGLIGYHVYKSINGSYIRMTNNPISGTSFTDPCLEENGTYEYMVRAVKLQDTPSGNYYNFSSGVLASVVVNDFNNCLTGLPVDLVAFEAVKEGDHANLSWETATEVNFSHFELERSNRDQRFFPIAKLQRKGNPSNGGHYQWLDKQPLTGINFYKLKIINLDGSYDYSDIKSVVFERKDMSLYPNPSHGKISIELPLSIGEDPSIEVFDFKGAKVMSSQLADGKTHHNHRMDVSHLPNGAYVIKAIGGESVFAKTFILESQ